MAKLNPEGTLLSVF